jgi:lipopolysaccharide export system protein LptA/lipopolysaccharide export system protein LptC
MRNTQAARYARWSALMALLLTALVAGVFLRHSWEAHLVHLAAPPRVPSSIQQQSNAFSFSKESGNRTEYTVRASRATQYTEGGRGVLEDVWITVYGSEGQRFDNLRTHSCDYLDATGSITCAGEVQIDLESAADARLHPMTQSNVNVNSPANGDARVVHIVTRNVSFNRETGIATTDQSVRFNFLQMDGQAVGFRYDSGQGEMRLLQDVELTVHRGAGGARPTAGRVKDAGLQAPSIQTPGIQAPSTPAPSIQADRESLRVTGSSLVFNRGDRMLHLLGPAKATEGAYELTAGQLDVALDEQLRARSLVASGHPELHAGPGSGASVAGAGAGSRQVSVSASEFSAPLAADGWIPRITATGNVHVREHTGLGDDLLDAAKADIDFAARSRQPRLLTATGNVAVQSDRGAGMSRHLATSMLEVSFVPVKKAAGRENADGSSVRIARITGPAVTIDSQEPANAKKGQASGTEKAEKLHLTSGHFEATFGAANQLEGVHGTGGVKLDRQIERGEEPGDGLRDGQAGEAPAETSTSREVVARFGAGGEWSSVDEMGDVHLREGESTAVSDRAHFERLSDTVGLSGSVAVSGNGSRTTAQSAVFHHATNEVSAEGRVITSDLAETTGAGAKPGIGVATGFGPGPAHVSGDRLTANASSGHATYSGHARLWQGDSVIEADTIELDRATQVIVANNHVRAVFPQAAWTGTREQTGQPDPANAALESHTSGEKPSQNPSQKPGGKAVNQPEFWRVETGKMTYSSNESRAQLEQGAKARSNEGSIRADAMELYFSEGDFSSGAVAPGTSAPGPSGPGAVASGRSRPAVSGFGNSTGAPARNPGSASAGIASRSGGQMNGQTGRKSDKTAGEQGGERQLVRATGVGHVIIDQEDRHGTGDRGEYSAAEGKFVLSGGPPSVYDDLGNSTSGRELTLFFADDKILVDSAIGLRTLTMHRVEK